MSWATAGAAALALALPLPPAGAQDAGSWCTAAGFMFELPPGWRVDRDVPDRGLVLQPPEPGAPRVEVLTWLVSVGVRGPEGAAEEHEWLLAAREPYRRTGLAAITFPGTGEGVLVEGVVSRTGAPTLGSLVTVFTRGARAYAVGLFAAPDELPAARVLYLEPVLERLALAVDAAEVQPAHASPPVRSTEFAGPTEPITPATPPRTDEASSPEPPVGARYTDPAGFSLRLPEGWRAGMADGVVRAESPTGAALFLVPVEGEAPGRLDAADLAARCVSGLGDAQLTGSALDAQGEFLWLRVTGERAGRPFAGRFSLSMAGHAGLLAGVFAPGDELPGLLPVAAEMLASFSAEPGASPSSRPRGTTQWSDAESLFECRVPAGWALRGHVVRYDGRPALALDGRAADNGAWFLWRQPLRPIFRDLTEAMRGLGFRDGDPYYAYDGVDPRMVLTRGATRDLVARHLLPAGAVADPLATEEEPLDALRLLGHPHETTSLVSVGYGAGPDATAGWLIVSRAPVGESRESWFWEAAALGFGGAPGRASAAARALEAVVRSVSIGPRADAATRSTLSALLAQGRVALDAPGWRALVGPSDLAPVLGGPKIDGPVRAARGASPETVTAWRALASDPRGPYNTATAE